MERHGGKSGVRWTERVERGPDGRYRWQHETLLFRNPVFLFLLWKIFFFIWLGVTLFVFLLAVKDMGLRAALGAVALPMLYVLLFLFALVALSYALYALAMGGRYTVHFTMDEEGVTHAQIARQFGRARKLGALTMLAGAAARSPGAVAAGWNAARRQAMYSAFRRVRAVRAIPRTHTIKLRAGDLTHNQVYTAPEDFEFVLSYIRARTAHARFRSSGRASG